MHKQEPLACLVFAVFAALCGTSAFAGGSTMPPGFASAPVAAASSRPNGADELKRSSISAADATRIQMIAPKLATQARDPRTHLVGEARLLSQAGLREVDVTALKWTADGAKKHATLVVTSRGAARLRVGIRIASRSAAALRIRVSGEGAEGEAIEVNEAALGAAQGKGPLWTPLTPGESQLVEFELPSTRRLQGGEISVIGASHIAAESMETGLAKRLGDSLSCQVDVACVDAYQGLDAATKSAFDAKVKSTAMLIITKDSGITVTCTGTLLNNDYHAPVFLTAFHCIGSESEANSVITRWNYQANECPAATYNPGQDRTGGAVWFNGSKELDEALIGLRDMPPSDAVLSGWDGNAYYPAQTLMLGMHHPRGDLKKTSVGTITGLQSSPFTIEGDTHAAYEFYTTQWQIGLVEPGSSGSGLFVQPAGQTYLALIGTLFSGPATPVCSGSTTYTNTFSRLDLFYPSVKRYFNSNYALNYTDLWWNPDESGWGLNIQQQGDTIFATWFTYDASGAGMWLVLPNGALQADGSYAGTLYRTTGTPFNLINGSPALDVPLNPVGDAKLSFSSHDAGRFSYTVNGISGSKAIQREAFSVPPTCGFTLAGRSGATNYQDIWYNPNEPGWGINLTHQGSTIFATWFTYDTNRQGMWLVMPNGALVGPNTYRGELYVTTGTPFSQINGSQAIHLPLNPVGALTLQFRDGQNAVMSYSVNGVLGSKDIQRQVFSMPTSVCH